MTGACTINGNDISNYGVLILRGSDHGFISFPERKEPVVIEWPDEDGFEISNDAPVYQAKKFTVNYYLKGNEINFLTRLNAFANLHFNANGQLSVYVREFDLTFSLRFAGISDLLISKGFLPTGDKNAKIGIDYVMDNPTANFNPAQTIPTVNRVPDTQVEIDAVDLSAFGIIVKKVYPTALKMAPKPCIIYDSKFSNGQSVIYPAAAKKQKQEISVACAMICDDQAKFMENWNALWHAVNVNSLAISLTAAGKSYAAFFSKMNDFKKSPWTGRAKAEFEMVFVGYEI